MKLISLNIWGGTVYEPLMGFLKKESRDTDVFCFQEVFSALSGAPKESSGAGMYLFDELQNILPDFSGIFEPRSKGFDFNGSVDFSVSQGLAMFVRSNVNIVQYRGEIIEQTSSEHHPVDGWVKAQVVTLQRGGAEASIINFHGVALPGDKNDTPQRINNANQLKLIWEGLNANKILCGDFNMYPNIKAIKVLESVSRNLISEFKIENTRNELSWKKFPGSKQVFADFTFVSDALKVKSFEVPYNEVSDHLPMILEFEL